MDKIQIIKRSWQILTKREQRILVGLIYDEETIKESATAEQVTEQRLKQIANNALNLLHKTIINLSKYSSTPE